jgi:prepilin-type N-terminal cleavage/methylation domain-containing protein
MLLKSARQKGFTIVELLIVIVVIGILAALVLNTFSGVQRRARDTERQTDITSVATQLEVYFQDNGKYPTPANLADDTWVSANLKGMDLNALRAPSTSTNNVQGTASTNKDQYGYVVLDSGNGTCDNTVTLGDCVKFTLSWWSEDKNLVQSKASLN